MKRFAVLSGLLAVVAACSMAGAQPAPGIDATGIWVGTYGDGRAIELHLKQETDGTISGDSLFAGGPELEQGSGSVEGELTGGGLALLQLKSPNSRQSPRLEMELSADTARARLVEPDQVTALEFQRQPPPTGEISAPRLWNHDLTPFQTYKPPEEYNVDFQLRDRIDANNAPIYHMVINVKLSGTLFTEVFGAWTLVSADAGLEPALNSDLRFRSGRVAAWNWVIGNHVSNLKFKTPDTISYLGEMDFDRLKGGKAGDSYFTDVLAKQRAKFKLYQPGQGVEGWPTGGDSIGQTRLLVRRSIGYRITLLNP